MNEVVRKFKVSMYDASTGEQIFENDSVQVVRFFDDKRKNYLRLFFDCFVRGLLAGKSLSISIDAFQLDHPVEQDLFKDVY